MERQNKLLSHRLYSLDLTYYAIVRGTQLRFHVNRLPSFCLPPSWGCSTTCIPSWRKLHYIPSLLPITYVHVDKCKTCSSQAPGGERAQEKGGKTKEKPKRTSLYPGLHTPGRLFDFKPKYPHGMVDVSHSHRQNENTCFLSLSRLSYCEEAWCRKA